MNLDWLTKVAQVLPDESNYQKSYFDIVGFPRWENVNSNLLAFYFDKEEEHNLSTLFIESLLEMLEVEDKNINYTEEYEVFRELRTDKGNFIDIVIKSKTDSDPTEDTVTEEEQKSDWAIIIENKIDSWVYNDLEDYWNSVKATHKIGFVLSKSKEVLANFNAQKKNEFKSITHKNLIEQVQLNLYQHFSKANEKHLILLKEYINNIDNIYINSFMNQKLLNSIKEFHKHEKEIKQLKQTETKLLKNIYEDVFRVFKRFNFEPSSKYKSTNGKHFYYTPPNKSKELINNEEEQNEPLTLDEGFRFWVRMESILYHHNFELIFELHKPSKTIYGDKVIELLSQENIFTTDVKKGEGGTAGKDYKHIYFISFPIAFDKEEFDLYEFLCKELSKHIFKTDRFYLKEAQKAFISATNKENTNQSKA
ncbi:PD-(D/E)XK nuclease family protein [Mesonia sp. K7]|uniref:PD-(D/E)XK nuclease family protein n=1 Tax=Mesonia sp. K7 TaxID=2218606 RepID=UPI000DA80D43|nr:PD-(D/E)XK nuclease family protein [Mesonia sp. K7]PZD79654.1 hypothetical protein DNG35_01215 [Mesonia sp. K7]